MFCRQQYLSIYLWSQKSFNSIKSELNDFHQIDHFKRLQRKIFRLRSTFFKIILSTTYGEVSSFRAFFSSQTNQIYIKTKKYSF